jgi:hypothetical protein
VYHRHIGMDTHVFHATIQNILILSHYNVNNAQKIKFMIYQYLNVLIVHLKCLFLMEKNVRHVQRILIIIELLNNVLNVKMEKYIIRQIKNVNAVKINLSGQEFNVLNVSYRNIMIFKLNSVNSVQLVSISIEI